MRQKIFVVFLFATMTWLFMIAFYVIAFARELDFSSNVISSWCFDGWENAALPKCDEAKWAVFCITTPLTNDKLILPINLELFIRKPQGNSLLFVTSSGQEKLIIRGLTLIECKKNVNLLDGLVVAGGHKLEALCAVVVL